MVTPIPPLILAGRFVEMLAFGRARGEIDGEGDSTVQYVRARIHQRLTMYLSADDDTDVDDERRPAYDNDSEQGEEERTLDPPEGEDKDE
jgi:hypothetical protein